ncbi:MAG TPA: protein translocase subunit SecD [Syntrophomonadaceae bacterium]|nr:protein translocase subunit SecD [Syntrophomonadaceae bacterium]
MQKNTSIAVVLIVVLVLGTLGYFLKDPIKDNLTLGLDLQGGLHVVLQAKEKPGQAVTDDTLQKSIGVLRERVDNLGVTEPNIYPQGSDRIVLELAGVEDPEKAVDMIKNTAQLEFWDEEGNVLLTGKNLKDAQATSNQDGSFSVALEFDKEGAKLFGEATKNNLDKPIAIVIDENIISAPVVQAHITNGRAEITGNFTSEEANNLAVLLRSGALPVSFEIMEKRTVGPTLGADSLNKSVKAALVGLLAILIFMIGYYRLPGFIADLSLILYGILVLGTMAVLGAVLTLPGIAGFALSIGMAVDANVIIYERVKEELRNGKTLKSAIEAGFKHAYWTILDANLTTLITAGVLMYFGSGPIKGFAVTLSIGIIASVLIALTFTRYMMMLFSNITDSQKMYGI